MGGVLAGLYLNDVYPAMGIAMTHKVLALMLIGTLACLRGAVLAAFALALLEGLVLPVIYRPLLSDAMLLVTLAVVSWVGPQESVIHIGLGESEHDGREYGGWTYHCWYPSHSRHKRQHH